MLQIWEINSLEEFVDCIDERMDQCGNPDFMFYYDSEAYMFQDIRFAYIEKGMDKYLSTMQEFDTWEELYENATMQDGVLFKDALKNKKIKI